MSGLKRKKDKKEFLLNEWVENGPYSAPEIRSDTGTVYARHTEESVYVFNPILHTAGYQSRIVVEQKVVWPDGEEHILPRILK